MAVLRLAKGCGTILHFGGASVERPFAEVLGPNIRGLFHIHEAARRAGARLVFASSNHMIGFRAREVTLVPTAPSAPTAFAASARPMAS